MPNITFRGHSYSLNPAESVLDALTRHGAAVPSSCRSGVCQTCTMKAVSGTPPAAAQEGLRDSLKEQGYFLACMCQPREDLEVALPDEIIAPLIDAQVIEKTELCPDVLRLRLEPAQSLLFRGGQFINLHHPDGAVRSYSIASASLGEDYLELHVRIIPGGKVSGWLAAKINTGDSVQIDGPHGDCYYQAPNLDQPLVLIGTGTGLAPLFAVVKDAFLQGHRGPIHLFHGGNKASDLYLVRQFQAYSEQHENFSYTACVMDESADSACYSIGSPAHVALAAHKDLKGYRIYLCGNPDMVRATKRKAFLAGASLSEIHTDPFEAATPAAPVIPATDQHADMPVMRTDKPANSFSPNIA